MWATIKPKWEEIIKEVDIVIGKYEESKVEDKKGQDSLSIQTILLEKLSIMKKLVT